MIFYSESDVHDTSFGRVSSIAYRIDNGRIANAGNAKITFLHAVTCLPFDAGAIHRTLPDRQKWPLALQRLSVLLESFWPSYISWASKA